MGKQQHTAFERRAIRKNIARLAIPNIISNITVPLLSLVDVGLAGHLPDPSSIGAIAIASGAINTLYWLFSFLRMGTTGYVAQAFGRQKVSEINLFFVRGLALALPIGVLLLFAKPLVVAFAQLMAQQETNIAQQAGDYLAIALWGAPAAMMLYVLNGWFIGMQNARAPMVAAITINCTNIVVSFSLVYFLGMGVRGLAIGTVVAQYGGVILLLALSWARYRRLFRFARIHDAVSGYKLKTFLDTGKDVFFRSVLISTVTLFFTYASVKEGELVVAANTLLLQLFTLFSYFTDGFAYAGEALTGRYVGMQNRHRLQLLIRQLFLIGGLLALATSVIYLFLPSPILHILSDKEAVIDTALKYSIWMAIVPLAGFAAFLWDGIFVGATFSKGLRSSMFIATAVFFILYYALYPLWSNHALWLAFVLYLAVRGLVQTILWQAKGRKEAMSQPMV